MSEPRKTMTKVPSRASNEDRAKETDTAESRRFTPLRSYMTRSQMLSRETRGELGLSRLVPAARLRSYA